MFTHDWGEDRSNHIRVVNIARALQSRGLRVWIDEFEMTGDINDQMTRAIDQSETVAVFITRRYITKVCGNAV